VQYMPMLPLPNTVQTMILTKTSVLVRTQPSRCSPIV
jgi:hypothetical protein